MRRCVARWHPSALLLGGLWLCWEWLALIAPNYHDLPAQRLFQQKMKKTIRPEDLSDEHLNHRRRFAGLPLRDAKELAQWRLPALDAGALCPDPPPSSDKPTRP